MNSKFGDCCNCPALIDARFFTEYRDRDELQFNIMKTNNITNSNDFRNYLIANGTNLIASNTKVLEDNYKCNYDKANSVNNSTPSSSINAGKYINGQVLSELNDNNGVP